VKTACPAAAGGIQEKYSMNRQLPAIFIGHGSPMNIVSENDFTKHISALGKYLSRPEAILVISAHWLTRGTYVTCMEHPRQIYDFYGFPEELYAIKYRCAGSPKYAVLTKAAVKDTVINCSDEWGLDHASWAVLKHMYPAADIPVYELSLDVTRDLSFHYNLGKELGSLRKKGVLIIGSGNIVHNLSLIDYDTNAQSDDWVVEIDETIKRCLVEKNHADLINHHKLDTRIVKAIPTLDHYLPMLYILGMQGADDKLRFIHEGFQNNTISMRCFILE
jgi:4,5-DOPA dioxygenase extradiol